VSGRGKPDPDERAQRSGQARSGRKNAAVGTSLVSGVMGLDPTLRSFGVLGRQSGVRSGQARSGQRHTAVGASLVFRRDGACPHAPQLWSSRTPKRCPVGASPIRTKTHSGRVKPDPDERTRFSGVMGLDPTLRSFGVLLNIPMFTVV
jgi:hypothetical protein